MAHTITNEPSRLTSPHDRFCRQTACKPPYAPDFFRNYGDSLLGKYIDLDRLKEAPTTRLTEILKELRMDAALSTRLLDPHSMTEVLCHVEHKSRPDKGAIIQLFAASGLSLYDSWTKANRPESNIALPIPIMLIIYNGKEDWEGEMWFQDLFPNLPEWLRRLVPQFRVIVINLRRFRYGHLPGRPETQAIAESLMRATDGTFADNLPCIYGHVAESDLPESMRLDLAGSITSYCLYTTDISLEQVKDTIAAVFRKQEYIVMTEEIKSSLVLEGIEIGRAEGEARGKVLAILEVRFNKIPKEIEKAIRSMVDRIALESLVEHAKTCKSLDEFAEALR